MKHAEGRVAAEDLEIMRKARELIADESKWTKDHEAVDVDEFPVDARDPYAIRWSLDGAVDRVAPDSSRVYQDKPPYALHRVSQWIWGYSGGYGNSRKWGEAHFQTHERVIRALDCYILELRAQEAKDRVAKSLKVSPTFAYNRLRSALGRPDLFPEVCEAAGF